jgi:flagellar assembly protein FliH
MVGMPLSKIIKAYQDPGLERFEFFEIGEALSDTDPAPQPDQISPDPMLREDPAAPATPSREDMDHIIRNRLLEAERQAQETEKLAYENGYAQGQKDGFEYGRKSALVVQEQLENVLLQLGALPSRAFRDYRDWFIQSSLSMARCIVQNELKTNPDGLYSLVTSLLHEAQEHQTLTLYLNPRDLDLLRKNTPLESWIQQFSPAFSLKTDAALTPGGCRLESDLQLLDATLETRFAFLEETLTAPETDLEVQSCEAEG